MTKFVAPSIARLVERARSMGKLDPYTGKRDNNRYRARVPVEITLDPDSDRRMTGELHDVSLSGAGFIAHEELKPKQSVYIRAWDPQSPDEWIKLDIVHVTKALSGFLVGAQFADEPIAAPPAGPANDAVITDVGQLSSVLQSTAGPGAPPPQRSAPRPPRAGTPSRVSLRAKCAMIAATCGTMGVVAGVLLAMSSYWQQASFLLIGGFALCCAAVSAVLMWLFLGDEARFLRTLNQHLTGQKPDVSAAMNLPTPASTEFHGLDAVLDNLHTQISRHNEAVGRQKERLGELDEIEGNILNVVAHDLRTPLTSIVLHTELMKAELPRLAPQDLQHCVHVIGVETNRLTRLIENLMQAHRAGAGSIETKARAVEVQSVIDAALADYRPLAEQKQISIEYEHDGKQTAFSTDPNLLGQIVANLVANALHYAPTGGHVFVSTAIQGNELELSVSDNGPGIDREYWDQIFNRFVQVQSSLTDESPGVGIGLYVVKELVKTLRGRIWLDSLVGKGSEFNVALRALDENTKLLTQAQPKPTRGRALVCDTDAELLARLAALLENEGWHVTTAYCGKRLMHRVSHEPFDLVVTDVAMHDVGADELIPLLTDNTRSYRLVVHTHCELPEALREHGFDAVVSRPAAREELLRAINEAPTTTGRFAPMLFVAEAKDALHGVGEAFAEECKQPIVAENIAEARTALSQLHVDRILLSEALLDETWSGLSALATDEATKRKIVVVCEDVDQDRRTRALEREVGIAKLSAVIELSATLRDKDK